VQKLKVTYEVGVEEHLEREVECDSYKEDGSLIIFRRDIDDGDSGIRHEPVFALAKDRLVSIVEINATQGENDDPDVPQIKREGRVLKMGKKKERE